jgi:glutathione S-transferase
MITLHNNNTFGAHFVRHVLAYKQPSGLKIVNSDSFKLQHDKVIIDDPMTAAEYLDEIMPVPLLMPVYPAARAVIRNLIKRHCDYNLCALLKSTDYLYSPQPTLLDLWVLNFMVSDRSTISQSRVHSESRWLRTMLDSSEYKISRSLIGRDYAAEV